MKEFAIEINNLDKLFRMYKKPRYRVMHTLGIPVSKQAYHEFWALKGINLRVLKGLKLGIVGRNGAGKSTLLKIIANQLSATSGTVVVRGKVHALMELGTGFHPEFSGWQNILSALSYLGLTGNVAKKEAENIVEFTELEDFIHNPLQTYSAGMHARLAFAVATNISPEILIIDEILGAGDSYFSQKAFERIKQLTSGGTTVLFVSHDMSSVERLCDEAIWIERGRLVMRSPTIEVSKAYYDMNRKREEMRLKAKNSLMKVSTFEQIQRNHQILQLICRLTQCNKNIDINQVDLLINQRVYAQVKIGDVQDASYEEAAFVLLDRYVGQWSKPKNDKHTNIHWRSLARPNDSAAVVFNLDGLNPTDNFSLRWHTRGSPATVQFYDGNTYQPIGSINASPTWSWQEVSIPQEFILNFLKIRGLIKTEDKSSSNSSFEATIKDIKIIETKKKTTEYEIFTGHISLEGVDILNGDFKPQFVFQSFEDLIIRIRYKTLQDIYQPEFVISFFHKGSFALQGLSRFDESSPEFIPEGTQGEIIFRINRLPFGRGNYFISIGVYPPINRHSLDTEKTAYTLQDRRYEIKVEQPEGGHIELGFARGECNWSFEKNLSPDEA